MDVSRFMRRHYFFGNIGPTVLNFVRYGLRRTRDRCTGRSMVLCLITFLLNMRILMIYLNGICDGYSISACYF